MNPSQRTHTYLRDRKIRCGSVERFLQNRKSDLYGFIDQIALNPRAENQFPMGILAIQSTGGDSNGNGNARVEKIRSEILWPAAQDVLDCGGHLYVFSWVRLKSGHYDPRFFKILDQSSPVEWTPLP